MSALVHASMWQVFSLWTGGQAWEEGLEAQRLAACTLQPVPWGSQLRMVCGNRVEVTCPACVVLCESAAGQHERNICTDCRSPFEPNDPPGFTRRKRPPGEEWFSLCSDCGFWDRLLRARSAKSVIVKGTHYVIGDPQFADKPPPPRDYGGYGFGGARWEILFSDGRREVTHNLWHQGVIPARFRERPEWADNATFAPQPQVGAWL